MRYLRPGRFSTMDKVDVFLLELELIARRKQCEVPHCTNQAVGYFSPEMPIFICSMHAEARDKGFKSKLKALVIGHQRTLVIAAANRAWAHTEDDIVFTYDPAAAVERYITAPVVVHEEQQAPAVPKVRPALPTLATVNAETPLLEFFPSF